MKDKLTYKEILKIVISIVFIIYISLSVAISNRKYLYIESILKNISSSINTYFIDKCYMNSKSDNLIKYKKEALKKENNALRKELSLNKENNNYVLSEIVNHTSINWFNTMTINKGYKWDIKKDNPVVNSDGLVGFITKTGKNVSEVELLTNVSKSNSIPVIIENSDGYIAGMLTSYNIKKDLFKITDITYKQGSLENKKVYLASYDNNLYNGIYIGTITNEKVSNYGLTKDCYVKSSVNFNDLLFVSVVTDK